MIAPLGILMLDTRFPRRPGDVGNPATWDFPVLYGVVAGATAERAVLRDPADLLAPFVAEGRRLGERGARGIATTCGFLSTLQAELARALGVPVATSALMQAPLIAATLPPGRRVGILTISADTLASVHLGAAGVPEGTPVEGVDNGHFADAILGDRAVLDPARCRAELVAGAERLMARGDIGAILLECTNMPPWAADIRAATGVPVFSAVTFLRWFQAGLEPPRFG